MVTLIKSSRKYLIYGLYLSLCMHLFIHRDNVEAGSATRSGGGAIATKASRSRSSSSRDSSSKNKANKVNTYSSNPNRNLTILQKLKEDIFEGYDKDLIPVMDYRDHVDIEIDLTFRQILDLDEKNQILKSLIWLRLYWIDVNLKWEPSEYDGMENISIPTNNVWTPDLVLYEGVGALDYDSHLPFVRLSYTGQILLSEPRIIETSCSVNTAFFPFDSQKCSFTFVSWTQSVKHIDLRSQRTSEELQDESIQFFINTGEWVLKHFEVIKRISYYGTDEVPIMEVISDETADNKTEKTQKVAKVSSQVKSYIELPADHNSDIDMGEKLTEKMFAEVKYSLIIQRNSSLYMQSMLFPSILLTTVALLGFFLPPDSGERVGLQITILLTFMVFLLTVGEMFPASTGPYIGIYFVMSMAQLGVNIVMTIVVLHLHFKPCVRDKSTWKAERPRWYTVRGVQYEGESLIPVRTRRILQFLDKYFDVAEEGATWMRPIRYHQGFEDGIHVNESSKSTSVEEKQSNELNSTDDQNQEKLATDDMINSNMVTDENGHGEDPPVPNVLFVPDTQSRKKSQASIATDISEDDHGNRKLHRMSDVHKIIRGLQHSVKDMAHNIQRGNKKDEDDEFEESVEQEQEEWKSVARAVDSLFFRLYLFIIIASYIGLIGVAVHGILKPDPRK